MTNPGHLDPGYEGHLHLTAINMGRESFEIRDGELIVTVVIFELASEPRSDFASRYKGLSPSSISQGQLDRLSADFANVQERATKIASDAVKEADLFSIKRAQYLFAAGVGTLVTILLTIFTFYWNGRSKAEIRDNDYGNLEKRIDDKLAASKEIEELKRQIERLNSQMAALKQNQNGK